MKNFLFVLFLLLSLSSLSQWEKQGVASGVVNDITCFDHGLGETNFVHLGEESGIFYYSEMYPDYWNDESGGLKNSSVKKVCGLLDNNLSVHSVLTGDGVYASINDWVWADEQGLQNGTGQPIG